METDKSLKIIQANIRRKISRRKSSSSKKSSSRSVFIDDYIANSTANIKSINANKISRFLKSKLIVDKYTLDNRVSFLSYIRKKLHKIKEDDCIETKTYSHGNGYTIRNILNIENKISGDNNFGGVIYKTSVRNAIGVFPIATKVMEKISDNLYEVKLMADITNNIIIDKISKHFLILYMSCLCEKDEYSKSKRLISVNEIANGDLGNLIDTKEVIFNKELLYNLLFQSLISIGTFHNLLSHVHADCHGGNFLWHYNNEKGYYHYIFNGKNLYLKACRYNIMIYDFGFAKKIKKNNIKKIISDYFNTIPIFLNEDYINDRDLSPDSNVKNELNDIIKTLTNIYDTIDNEGSSSSPKNIQNNTFSIIINEIFKKYNINNMFITDFDSDEYSKTKRPTNIINKKPYYINII